jgi:cation diffusion facilitator family transporter
LGWIATAFHWHGHSDQAPMAESDPAFGTREGIRTVWIALAALGITTVLQVIIVVLSGSVALLADTVHNFGDFLNSVPLLAAFYVAGRRATRRFTYGFGRAEDVAGVLIVLSIVFSAGYILWESFQKLLDPEPLQQLPWVAAAAVIGFIGNEAVAVFQIRTGRKIGSDALVADGLHARIDGLTSLVVLAAVAGSALGYPIVDPIVGLAIGVTIVFIARDATKSIWYRLMDAVDPAVTSQIEQYTSEIKGVSSISSVRARWIGHELVSEVAITLDDASSLEEAQRTVGAIRSVLLRNVRHLTRAIIEIDSPVVEAPEGVATPKASATSILPPRYQEPGVQVSAAPMGSADMQYDENGEVAWDEMWTGFCELALAGGAPHRGTLLEPVHAQEIAANPEGYERVLQELERGLTQVTGLPVVRSMVPGWIGLECTDEEMALWLLRAIVVENVTVRREGNILWFPAGPGFRLEGEIKNVITVVAKTTHYWQEHIAGIPAGTR